MTNPLASFFLDEQPSSLPTPLPLPLPNHIDQFAHRMSANICTYHSLSHNFVILFFLILSLSPIVVEEVDDLEDFTAGLFASASDADADLDALSTLPARGAAASDDVDMQEGTFFFVLLSSPSAFFGPPGVCSLDRSSYIPL